jgi:hypothetical protein
MTSVGAHGARPAGVDEEQPLRVLYEAGRYRQPQAVFLLAENPRRLYGVAVVAAEGKVGRNAHGTSVE